MKNPKETGKVIDRVVLTYKDGSVVNLQCGYVVQFDLSEEGKIKSCLVDGVEVEKFNLMQHLITIGLRATKYLHPEDVTVNGDKV